MDKNEEEKIIQECVKEMERSHRAFPLDKWSLTIRTSSEDCRKAIATAYLNYLNEHVMTANLEVLDDGIFVDFPEFAECRRVLENEFVRRVGLVAQILNREDIEHVKRLMHESVHLTGHELNFSHFLSTETISKTVSLFETMPEWALYIQGIDTALFPMPKNLLGRPTTDKCLKEAKEGVARLALIRIKQLLSQEQRTKISLVASWLVQMMTMDSDVDKHVVEAIGAIEHSENYRVSIKNPYSESRERPEDPTRGLRELIEVRRRLEPENVSPTAKRALDEAIQRCEARQKATEVSDLPLPKTLRKPPAPPPEPKKDKVR